MVLKCIEEVKCKLKINGKLVRQTDIGVVSPYTQQCSEIRAKLCKKGHTETTVGSAEVFQGQQRPVIIISTVRTGNDIGFVNDPKVHMTPVYY